MENAHKQIAIVARDEVDAASLRSLGQAADFAAPDLAACIAPSELKGNQETSS